MRCRQPPRSVGGPAVCREPGQEADRSSAPAGQPPWNHRGIFDDKGMDGAGSCSPDGSQGAVSALGTPEGVGDSEEQADVSTAPHLAAEHIEEQQQRGGNQGHS